jgi:hypothetical protein
MYPDDPSQEFFTQHRHPPRRCREASIDEGALSGADDCLPERGHRSCSPVTNRHAFFSERAVAQPARVGNK